MADIHIERQHGMGLAQARKAAFKWAEQAEEKFDMECTYEEGKTSDEVSFTRSGVSGTLTVTKDSFELQAKLGFLLGAFKEKIENEIVKNLDALISKNTPVAQKSPHAPPQRGSLPPEGALFALGRPSGKKAAAKKAPVKKA